MALFGNNDGFKTSKYSLADTMLKKATVTLPEARLVARSDCGGYIDSSDDMSSWTDSA